MFGELKNEKYLEYTADILSSGQHLLTLINEILDLSKIEAGEFGLTEEECDLGAILETCSRMVQGDADSHSITVDSEVPATMPRIFADERLIKQIVLNLLTNAIKFNVANGKVRLSSHVTPDNEITFVVEDTGIGIEPGDVRKVLEPFGQSRSDAHRAHEGTGLGLSLSKQFINLHGGSLQLDSTPGKGTTVTVTFPAERTLTSA